MAFLSEPVLLITNPAARRAQRLLPAALAAFRAGGVKCELALTERPGHAAELASLCPPEYDAVFVLGGDGTVMEVVGALANTGRPVGIIPGGTGNLVARSLGIPINVPRAVERLLHGRTATVDLGALHTGRRFAFSVSAGVDARMIAETTAAAKRRFGIAAYALTAGRAALQCRTFHVRATVDEQLIEREAAAVMVANFGGVLNDLLVLGPGIRGDDGLLDLCLFSPAHAGQVLALSWRLLRQRFDAHPAVVYQPGRVLRIECDPPQLYQADGEVLGHTPFEARAEPGAATLLVPRHG
jgi:YegS/Rv2252/BmrU family lipid kinase